ncbi:MAG: LysR family transcriptional regulator [Herbaspirillum sp.]|nr:LysR family transcriptional regulator [Herbaspirillum sp.]
MGLSQPSVSRIISALEQEIGAALLTRTTRAVMLTEVGADYLGRIEPILAALEEADHVARGTGELRGILRIGVTTCFAVRDVIPRLPAFIEQHPALRIEFSMGDRLQDLVAEGVDVALRFGALADSAATAKKIGLSSRLLAASPEYLKRVGTPKIPADLAAHSLIVGPAGASSAGWSFLRDNKTTSIHVEGRLIFDVNEAATAAAVAGLGIVSTGTWGCRPELESGALVQILKEWTMDPVEVNAVFAAGCAAKPSARAFTEFLAASLRGA